MWKRIVKMMQSLWPVPANLVEYTFEDDYAAMLRKKYGIAQPYTDEKEETK